MDRSFACSLSSYGAFFSYICAYWLGTFYRQYAFSLLSWRTGGGDFRLQAVLFSLSLIRNDGQSLCVCFHTESPSSRSIHLPLWTICCDYRFALRDSQPLYPAVRAILPDAFRDKYHWKCSDSRNQPSWAYRRCSRRRLSSSHLPSQMGEKDVQY